ncbi:hypothetical protein CDD81_6582 [Ophiocordyceps australis]|uniref:Rhodanese domain-containing protein n=1 Tax=Ophiocordyceps australis TaxID=1399860 RepID=A0A2C5X9F4_9HYPO|nr:hypothetical protein CDD81_6582 [Ophiocordyceps australis]
MDNNFPYVTIRSLPSSDTATGINGHAASTNGFAYPAPATHDTSRTSFHVKHVRDFAQTLEDSASRAFPNRGRAPSQRYRNVQVLLLHWESDDLFVFPEVDDLRKCFNDEYGFETDMFIIPIESSHLELMMRLGQLVKEHESEDTLFIIYYGGHARIDESRQSTWCANRKLDSPWLQWSAIQTLLERSKSDVLILLDCCAGAASATFAHGNSTTETISASSWDAIAPEPGPFSFTNVLIEVFHEWRLRIFSAAMLHAEVLARLKHPRPTQRDGTSRENRSTPVHVMMTANHKAPSIELSRMCRPSEPNWMPRDRSRAVSMDDAADALQTNSGLTIPTETTPHVMISLALEDDQRLDIRAWEQWLVAFPAMAKHVQVQGVFQSYSTLLLVSMPVTIWDLLPDDNAISFVAFIRSNNLVTPRWQPDSVQIPVPARQSEHDTPRGDSFSFTSGTTYTPSSLAPCHGTSPSLPQNTGNNSLPLYSQEEVSPRNSVYARTPPIPATPSNSMLSPSTLPSCRDARPAHHAADVPRQHDDVQGGVPTEASFAHDAAHQSEDLEPPTKFADHVEKRLEHYYSLNPFPDSPQRALIASNVGVECRHVTEWYSIRIRRDADANSPATIPITGSSSQASFDPRMILPEHLSQLLEILLPLGQIMLFDIRSPTDFEKSHICGAINFRAPCSFLEKATLEMMRNSIAGEEGRQTFSTWKSARCIVFYSRGLASRAEFLCARLVSDRLRENGWSGHCFILKGHFREFSCSYNGYISGSNMADRVDWHGQAGSCQEDASTEGRYGNWLLRLESEGGAQEAFSFTPQTHERSDAARAKEEALEKEFEARCGPLIQEAREWRGMQTAAHAQDKMDRKAGMVEYLDRGLMGIRGKQNSPSGITYAPGHVKVASSGEYQDVTWQGDQAAADAGGARTPTH